MSQRSHQGSSKTLVGPRLATPRPPWKAERCALCLRSATQAPAAPRKPQTTNPSPFPTHIPRRHETPTNFQGARPQPRHGVSSSSIPSCTLSLPILVLMPPSSPSSPSHPSLPPPRPPRFSSPRHRPRHRILPFRRPSSSSSPYLPPLIFDHPSSSSSSAFSSHAVPPSPRHMPRSFDRTTSTASPSASSTGSAALHVKPHKG